MALPLYMVANTTRVLHGKYMHRHILCQPSCGFGRCGRANVCPILLEVLLVSGWARHMCILTAAAKTRHTWQCLPDHGPGNGLASPAAD